MTTTVESDRNRALLDWYRRGQRALPWRGDTDAYATLVSEVMLQQTQASRVIPHFERFMAAFPTAESLAATSFADVAAVWSGLGYNTRAKRLHEAIRIVVRDG